MTQHRPDVSDKEFKRWVREALQTDPSASLHELANCWFLHCGEQGPLTASQRAIVDEERPKPHPGWEIAREEEPAPENEVAGEDNEAPVILARKQCLSWRPL